MTRDRLIREWPDSPNPYSGSDESLPGGQLVNDGDVLRAMDAWHAELARCKCEHDIDWEGRPTRKVPPGGCPVHGEEEQ